MMLQDEPSLNAIQSFAVTAKYLSFTEAANELCVTQGAVSRMVRKLEQDLGIPLFRRISRGIELTPLGSAYYTEVSAALYRISAATRSLRSIGGQNLLTIGVLPTFAIKWLVPHLQDFQKTYPDIFVDLVSKSGPPNLSAEKLDVCICYGAGNWNNIDSRLLFRERTGVYCSPSLMESKRSIKSPRQLKELPLLVHSNRPEAWNTFFSVFHEPPIDLKDFPRFEHLFMIVEAVAAGLGIALLPTFIADKEVQSGRIRQILPNITEFEEGYYVAHAVGAASARKISLFKHWLLTIIKKQGISPQTKPCSE